MVMFMRRGPAQADPEPPTATTSDWKPVRLPVGTTFTIEGVVGPTNWNDAIGLKPGMFQRKIRVTVEVIE